MPPEREQMPTGPGTNHARAEAAPAVRALLSSAAYGDRLAGLEGIAALGPDESLAALATLSRDESPSVRSAAMEALRRQGAAAVPVLVEIAAQRSHPQRLAALQAIGGQRASAAPALPTLVAILDDPEAPLRDAATWAIVGVGAEHLPVAGLDHYLQRGSTDEGTRARLVLRVLGETRPLPEAALPLLERLLTSSDAEVRSLALRAAGHAQGPAPRLVRILGAPVDGASDEERRAMRELARRLSGPHP